MTAVDLEWSAAPAPRYCGSDELNTFAERLIQSTGSTLFERMTSPRLLPQCPRPVRARCRRGEIDTVRVNVLRYPGL